MGSTHKSVGGGYYRRSSATSGHHRHAVRSPATLLIGTGPTEENPAVHVLRRPPEGLRLGRLRTVVEGAGPGRRTVRYD